ncbi:MAG: HD domain-containing phosphohydrolase [Gemmatimonadota bacterium]
MTTPFRQPVPPEAPPGSARCLVVDDDPLVRRSLCRVLLAQGMEPIEAESGEAALAMLMADRSIPLVITDLYMPGMDGLTLVREVRSRCPDTAVLVVTGVADVDTAVKSFQLGAADYLSKPVLMEEVRARVQSALEKRRLVLENRWLQQSYQERLETQLRELTQRNKEMFLGQIQMAVRMLEARDIYTRGHSQRVSIYATKTAVQLGITGDLLEQVRLGGELHDIGKIGTRDEILNKPGALTEAEFKEVQRHVTEGEEILAPLRRDHPIMLQIVRSHHEHLDGSGFPDGLEGDAIPLPARIVSVADAFDAMTTNRAYRETRTAAEALKEIERHAGTQFDREVVGAFQRGFRDLHRLPIRIA